MPIANREDDSRLDTHPTKPEDINGKPDPTVNVSNQLLAAIRRLDDLAALNQQWAGEMRAAERGRADDLRAAESRRVDEQAVLREQIAALRAEHYEKLLLLQAANVAANRAEDKSAAQLAAERLAVQVTALATTQTTTAETLRGQVGTAAQSQQQQVINPLLERLLQVEQTIAKGQGRAQEAYPAQAQALDDIRTLLKEQSQGSGRGAGANQLWVIILGALGGAGILYGILSNLP